jgi:hypothetical protein
MWYALLYRLRSRGHVARSASGARIATVESDTNGRWSGLPILIALLTGVWLQPANGDDETFQEAVAATKPIADLRMRYEGVDEDGFPEDAAAGTLRGRFGFETGRVWSLSLLAEAELVRALDSDYNDTLNGKTQYPVVADPPTDEINRLQLTSTIIPDTQVTLGRQRIIYDDHRFVGNSGWRQNEQTFDALRIVQRSLDHVTIDLAYVNQVNRVLGKDSPAGRYTGDNYLVNVSREFAAGKLTGFAYLLDLHEAPADSSETLGVRYTHKWKLPRVDLAALLSAATQADRAANPVDYSDDYYAGDVTATVGSWSVGGGVDLLQGDGVKGFDAPIGTLHKFQGWADKFLTTPPNGIDDRYLSVAYGRKGTLGLDAVSGNAVFHRFDAQRGSAHYGSELDVTLQATWHKLVASLTWAGYEARDFAGDTSKLWLQLEFAY